MYCTMPSGTRYQIGSARCTRVRQSVEGIARAGEAASLQYDWEVVADKVYEVYKLAIDTGSPAVSGSRSARNLIRGRGEEGR